MNVEEKTDLKKFILEKQIDMIETGEIRRYKKKKKRGVEVPEPAKIPEPVKLKLSQVILNRFSRYYTKKALYEREQDFYKNYGVDMESRVIKFD
jgi:hypothetical protein